MSSGTLAAVCLVALVLALLAAARMDASPSLTPSSLTPLALRGTGFAPGEAVRVELVPGRGRRPAVRSVEANRDGRFRVGFDLVALEPCRGTVVATATGLRGSRATWKRPCRPPHEQPPSRSS